MADTRAAREKPLEQFYEVVEDIHAGMLGVEGSGLQLQPMAPQVDRAQKTIWFFTKTDAKLTQAVTPGARARFVVIGSDHDYHACVSGPIEQRKDPDIIERFWNPIVGAWFEGGKEDPALTLLALRLEDGEAWVSTGSSVRFGWEIAKANLKDEHDPDVGVRIDLSF